MRIAVYGCGAMGVSIGALLSHAGISTEMIDIDETIVQNLNQTGAKLTGYEHLTQPVHAYLPEQMEGIYDFMILAVKQTANPAAMKSILPHLNEHSLLITIQDGFPEQFLASDQNPARVIGAVCNWGATFIEPGVSEITQPLKYTFPAFEIGMAEPVDKQILKQAAQLLKPVGVIDIVDDLAKARWSKLLWNCSMSGISTVLGCTFGEVLDNKDAMNMIGYVATEVGQVCKAAGCYFEQLPSFHLDFDQLLKKGNPEAERCLIDLFHNSYGDLRTAKAGMLQDLERGRKTEIDFLNGYICKLGKKFGIPTPVNNRISDFIHKIESGEQPLSFPENPDFLIQE